MESKTINLANHFIQINFNDKKAAPFFEKEYMFLLYDGRPANFDYVVNIYFGSKNKTGYLYKSTGRKFYFELNNNGANLFIPYKFKERDSFKIINPCFESKSKMCLIDFFHNTFIIILQILFLKSGISLFHASGFLTNNNKFDKAILFFGEAQSGKSTLVKEITTANKELLPISEDFCFISEKGQVFPLLHSTRIFLNNNYIPSYCDEKFNILLTKCMRKKPLRRISLSEYFSVKSFRTNANAKYILILDRKSDSPSFFSCDQKYFLNYCVNVMKNEFENMFGLKPVLDFYQISYVDFVQQIHIHFSNLFKNVPIFVMRVPIYKDINDTIETILNLMNEVGQNE